MIEHQESAPPRVGTGTGQNGTERRELTADRLHDQGWSFEDAAFRSAVERIQRKAERRQEVADRLAEARLELTLLQIEIKRAELAEIREGGADRA